MKLFSAEIKLRELQEELSVLLAERNSSLLSSSSGLKVSLKDVNDILDNLRLLKVRIMKAKCNNKVSANSSLSIYEAEVLLEELDVRARLSCSLGKVLEDSPVDYYGEFCKHLNVKSSIEEEIYLAKLSVDI